jgi:RHS repeat-associated protein
VLADTPAAYYQFAETSGTTFADSSPNGYTGTWNGSYSLAQAGPLMGAADKSVRLSVSGGGYGTVPSQPSIDSTTTWTLEAWINSNSPATQQGILEKYSTSLNQGNYAFRVQNSRIVLYVCANGNSCSWVQSSASIAAGTWYHVAATFDRATTSGRIYINGLLDGYASNLNILPTGSPDVSLKVGARGDDATFAFQGYIAEPAVYSRVLDPSRIMAHYRASGPVPPQPSVSDIYAQTILGDRPAVYYRLNEPTTTGPGIADASGNGYNGVLWSSYTRGAAGALQTVSTTSTQFSGGLGGTPTNALIDSTTGWTLEAWVKTTQPTVQQGILEKYNGDTGNYALRLDSSAHFRLFVLLASICCPWTVITGATTVQANTWYHVVGTYDAASTTAVLYVNGQVDASYGSAIQARGTPYPLRIGGRGDDSTFTWQGNIDEVAVYPFALSASQVQSHYGAGGLVGGDYTAAQGAGGGFNDCVVCNYGRENRTLLPVDTATGNFWHTFNDINIPGRSYPLAFTRTYNSQSSSINSPIGYGWQFNHAASLSVSGSIATITQENGSQVTFNQSGNNWVVSAPRFIATLTRNPDLTWTFVRFNRDMYKFNSSGQLISETDLNGYVTTFAYTGGNLTGVTDPGGRSLTIGWTGPNVTSVTDANVTPNRTVTFQYNDGNGNLTDSFDVAAGHWQFSYDTSHRMLIMKDPKCYATAGCPGVQNNYDASGRVSWQKDQLNRQTSFDYTSIAGATKVTDPKANVEVIYYTQGLKTAVTKGYGTAQAATWRYWYDGNSLALVQVMDPNGNRTNFSVDSNGNVLIVTDALGRQTVKTYNGFNQVLTEKDGNGVTTTSSYDTRGNLTSVSRPLTGTSQTQITTYNYTDAAHPGDVTSMVDADNKTWPYGYDSNGYRNSIKDPLGNQSTAIFNGDGWKTSSVSPKGNVTGCGCAAQYTTSYGYNAFGQPTTTTDPLTHATVRHYDADQNLDTLTDADGNLSKYVYDLANQQTQVKRADTPQTILTTDYNPDGTVLAQKDGKNNAIVSYGYDSLARVTSTTDALGNITAYTYDGAGNRITKQDPGGNCSATPRTGCTTLTYDAANQLKTISYSDGITPNVTNVGYDGIGKRTAMTDGTGTSSWVWDSLGRLKSYTNGAGAQVQYAYNLRNLPTTITYPGGLNVTRGYDDAGRLTSVQDWGGNTTAFGYDPNSNLTTETLPTGTGVVDTFNFDAADRLMSISDVKGGTTLFSATYTRDNANQLASDSSVPSSTGAYKYTALNQLCYAGSSSTTACAVPPSGSIAYSYDAADNLTQMGSTQQTFNNADQLCWTAPTAGTCAAPPSGATTYTYDTRGNRTGVTPPSGPTTTLTYDQANRLTGYGTSATYAYNGDGLRMSKTVSSTTSQFLWDGAGLPLLIKDSSTAYVYGPGDLPLEQVSGSTVLWLHHDQIGSTRLVTDSVGTAQATYAFDPYGNLVAITGLITNPVRFSGQYQDSESSLYYLRARSYDPVTGQFISRDTLSALMPYGYVSGNPLNATDPSGHFALALAVPFFAAPALVPLAVPALAVVAVVASVSLAAYLVYDRVIEPAVGTGVAYGNYLLAKKSRSSDKERSTDRPSWAPPPLPGESGKEYAKRVCDERYDPGTYDTGPRSEYNRLKKWLDRRDR